MTEKRHFLTEVLKPIERKKSYFNRNILPLKHLLITTLLLFSLVAIQAQGVIEFVENKGQWDSRVRYKGNVSNGEVFLRNGGITFLQHNPVDMANIAHKMHRNEGSSSAKENTGTIVRSHSWNVDFIGASPTATIVPSKPQSYHNNYFVGSDPSKWAENCKVYQAVTIENIYPNIDARYYTDNGFLKYDLIVKPGGDVSKIALRYAGVDKLDVKNKELVISTSLGDMKEGKPYTYQPGVSGRSEINCRYIVKNNVLVFDIKEYDRNAVLVIDPFIVFCSFSGSSADNWGFTATYGPDGAMFGGGQVYGAGFPTQAGAAQTNFGGGSYDIGIIKLSPDGSTKMYATYLGGNANDQPHSLVTDNQGNVVVAGRSNSGNYPVMNNGSVAGSDYDIVITKLNPTGGMLGSRKIGGSSVDGANINPVRTPGSLQRNYGDDARSEVILDAAGNVYVASCTQSGNFPVTAGVFQGGNRGQQDGVLMKLNNTLGTILFASYMGGSLNDAAYVLSLAPNGDIYVGGGTESSNFLAGTQGGTIGTALSGTIDGFVAVINNSGTTVIRSTYIGTSGIDQVFGVQFDNNGFPYIMGQTTGNWQVVNNIPGTPAMYSNAGGKQFIAKLQPNLSGYVYSTMFGTGAATPNISPVAFLVDRCENVYMSGWGGHYDASNPFNSAGTTGLPVTPNAIKSNTDGRDFYFFVLERNAESQLFGSFFGENNSSAGGGDHVDGGTSRFDRNGVIYQAICANCIIAPPAPNFPVTAGAAFTTNNARLTNNGAGCNLAMVKIDMDLSGVKGGVQSAIDGMPRDTAGCVPLTVDFTDTIATAVSYEWYFDYVPGNPFDLTTTTPNAQWTFNTVGIHPVMLVAIDPNTCNIRDSSFMNIRVGATEAIPDFTATRLSPCEDFNYRFDNTTIQPPGAPFKPTSFVWDFDDGSPLVRTGAGPVTHQFAGPGTYFVKLTIDDTAYCNAPDSDTLRVEVTLNVEAGIAGPPLVCIGKPAQFTSTSSGAETYLWNFGDGNTSTDEDPVHTYNTAGPFVVTLTVFNPGSCNGQDVTTFNITVFDTPTALATFSPDPPVSNTPTNFTNLSSNAVRYKWLFGDGDSTETNTLQSVTHQYNASGTFTALLIAYNQAGCTDTFPMQVRSIIETVVDVPNAFTPLTNDENSIVFVRGFGIAKMQFTIWNRWGQKVFETNNRLQGWDGKVKGVVQPMDVYAYTLSLEFFDGQKLTKKGDITLIR
jgi:gliding motility-associated-like protein